MAPIQLPVLAVLSRPHELDAVGVAVEVAAALLDAHGRDAVVDDRVDVVAAVELQRVDDVRVVVEAVARPVLVGADAHADGGGRGGEGDGEEEEGGDLHFGGRLLLIWGWGDERRSG